MFTYTLSSFFFPFFFFNDPATTEIYTLSLHDALPISNRSTPVFLAHGTEDPVVLPALGEEARRLQDHGILRSEEHTSELQSRENLVCRLLLEKKKKKKKKHKTNTQHTIQQST